MGTSSVLGASPFVGSPGVTVLGKVGEGDPPPPRTSICRGCAFLQEWGLLLLRDPPPQHMGTEPRVPPVVPPNKALTLNNAWGPHLLPMGGGGGSALPFSWSSPPGGGEVREVHSRNPGAGCPLVCCPTFPAAD